MSTSDKLGDAYVELSVTGDLAGQVEKERDKAQERAKRRPVSIKTQVDAKGGGEALIRSLGGKGAFGTETAVASGVVGASVRFGQSAGGKVDPIMSLLSRASAPKDASDKMIAGMSAAGEGQRKAEERARADAEASRQAAGLGKSFNSLSKAAGGSAATVMQLLGRGVGIAGAVVGTATGAAAAATGLAHYYGGMANPAAGFRFDRAVADAQASLGRGLVPGLEYATGKVRQFGDVVAGNEGLINKWVAGFVSQFETFTRFVGFNKLAEENKGKSEGAAVSPYVGRFSSGEDYYKQLASFALTMTPPGKSQQTQEEMLKAISPQQQTENIRFSGNPLVGPGGSQDSSFEEWRRQQGLPPRHRTQPQPEVAPTGHDLDLTVIW